MTDVAAGMVRPFGQKDRLDAAFEKFVVKFRRSSRRGDCGGNRQRGQNRHAYESTSRHSTLHQRRRRSSSDGTSNANLDKLVPGQKAADLAMHCLSASAARGCRSWVKV